MLLLNDHFIAKKANVISLLRHHDTQDNDTQDNDTQDNDTQHKDIKHNNK
jgi:hypothetical protein